MTGWLPIDSAPHDGSTVLVADSFGATAAAFDGAPDRAKFEDIVGESLTDAEWDEECERYSQSWVSVDPLSGDTEYLTPSHWMPLPVPPADATGAQRTGASS
jgi:hypothetical protein